MGKEIDLDKALVELKDSYEVHYSSETLNALIASIPYAGGAISSVLFGKAQRKVQERTADTFKTFKERLESVAEEKVDKEFFESDEFVTLLILALEQIQTTHDREKLRMLATGLANAGLADFNQESRKELFLRILRDLAPEHIKMLESLRPIKWMGREDALPAYDRPPEHHLPILQSLVAHGLIREHLISIKVPNKNWTQLNANQLVSELQKLFQTPPSRGFVLTKFGGDFLKFFSEFKAEESVEPKL
jgi:hypothetical protein